MADDTNILPADQNFVRAAGFESSSTPGLVIAGQIDEITGRILVDDASTGTVTSVSVVTANGLAGTVATATTTPAITLSTTITGILQGNGTAISAITVGTGLSFVGGTLSATGDLSVTLLDVSANSTTAPLSLYTMTSTIPVEFRRSMGGTALYIRETTGEVLIGQSTTGSSRLTVVDTALNDGLMSILYGAETTPAANSSTTTQITHVTTAVSASNQAITAGLITEVQNNLTGGGAITDARSLNVKTYTAASTTTTSLSSIYLETGTTAGTVTTGYGLRIVSLQGTTKFGIHDVVGTNWVNNTGGKLAIGNLAPISIGEFGAPTAVVTTALGVEAVYNSTSGATNSVVFVGENRGASASTGGASVFLVANDSAALVSTDRLGGVFFMGSSSASAIRTASVISSVAAENWVDASTYATDLVFETTALSSTTRAQKFRVTAQGSTIMGGLAALATTATDGFIYVPTCAGTPTGVPTAQTGKCAMIFDTTGNKLWVYDGGWIGIVLI